MPAPHRKINIHKEIAILKKNALPIMSNIPMQIKMGKEVLRTGDVFEVRLKETKGYFQFIFKDDEYMGGHLIRGFTFRAKLNEIPDLNEIVALPREFFTYTWVFEGLKLGLWKRFGHCSLEAGFELPVFRQTKEFGPKIKKSYKWFLWSGVFGNQYHLGELPDELRTLDVPSIIPPSDVVEQLELQRDNTPWPD